MADDERTRLSRGYVRVDKKQMQLLLRSKFDQAGGTAMSSRLDAKLLDRSSNLFDENLVHDAHGSIVTLSCGKTLRARVVVDATGFESPITEMETPELARGSEVPLNVGFQIPMDGLPIAIAVGLMIWTR